MQALLDRAVDPGIDPARLPGPALDVCGTGGDKLDLFNVSTTACFVLAADGVAVIKHGNRAVTSRSGGSDVLAALGVPLDVPSGETLRRHLEQHGLGFLAAPRYHPAFRAVAGVRRQLAAEGTSTIFNLLGPLLNPARPAHQLVGVFSPALTGTFAEVLRQLGRRRVWAVHGAGGMDELSTLGETHVSRSEAGGAVTHGRHRAGGRRAGPRAGPRRTARRHAGGERAHADGHPDRGNRRARGGTSCCSTRRRASSWREWPVTSPAGVERAREAIGSGRARRLLERLSRQP